MKNDEEDKILYMEKRKLWIQITELDAYNFEGIIVHPYIEQQVLFDDFSSLAVELQKFMDSEFEMDYVECSRTFQRFMEAAKENKNEYCHFYQLLLSEIRPFEWEGMIWTNMLNPAIKFRGMKQLSCQIRKCFRKKKSM